MLFLPDVREYSTILESTSNLDPIGDPLYSHGVARTSLNILMEDYMNTPYNFTMAARGWMIALALGVTVVFILFPVPFALLQGPQHILLYIISGIFVVLLGSLTLNIIVKKVIVDGFSITVHKGLFNKFSLDVADIDRVDRITALTVYGKNENITVRAGARKFKVETLMNNSDKMIAFLTDNVEESKFTTITRDFSD